MVKVSHVKEKLIYELNVLKVKVTMFHIKHQSNLVFLFSPAPRNVNLFYSSTLKLLKAAELHICFFMFSCFSSLLQSLHCYLGWGNLIKYFVHHFAQMLLVTIPPLVIVTWQYFSLIISLSKISQNLVKKVLFKPVKLTNNHPVI